MPRNRGSRRDVGSGIVEKRSTLRQMLMAVAGSNADSDANQREQFFDPRGGTSMRVVGLVRKPGATAPQAKPENK